MSTNQTEEPQVRAVRVGKVLSPADGTAKVVLCFEEKQIIIEPQEAMDYAVAVVTAAADAVQEEYFVRFFLEKGMSQAEVRDMLREFRTFQQPPPEPEKPKIILLR